MRRLYRDSDLIKLIPVSILTSKMWLKGLETTSFHKYEEKRNTKKELLKSHWYGGLCYYNCHGLAWYLLINNKYQGRNIWMEKKSWRKKK